MQHEIISRFQMRHTQMAEISLGYGYFPLAMSFTKACYDSIEVDLEWRKVNVNYRESYIKDLPMAIIQAQVHFHVQLSIVEAQQSVTEANSSLHTVILSFSQQSPRSRLHTTNFSVLAECDASLSCVRTQLSKTGNPDMSYIVGAVEPVACYLHPVILLLLESTTYLDTIMEVVLPILRAKLRKGRTVGTDFFLAFSTEQVDPGGHVHDNSQYTKDNPWG